MGRRPASGACQASGLAARTPAGVRARRGMDGTAVRSERPLRARAPVMGGIVPVVERELVRVGHGHHVHALVTEIPAMVFSDERRRWLWRIHGYAREAARIARLTAVFAT